MVEDGAVEVTYMLVRGKRDRCAITMDSEANGRRGRVATGTTLDSVFGLVWIYATGRVISGIQ